MRSRFRLFSFLLLAGCLPNVQQRQQTEPQPVVVDREYAYPNVLRHRGLPAQPEDWSFAPFSDQGSWLGWALPPSARTDLRGGFTGPFHFGAGRYVGPQLVRLVVEDAVAEDERSPVWVDAESVEARSAPGKLLQRARAADLSLEMRLWFDSARTSLIHVDLLNRGTAPRQLSVSWTGEVFPQHAMIADRGGDLVVRSSSGIQVVIEAGQPMASPVLEDHGYVWHAAETLEVPAGDTRHLSLAISWSLDTESSTESARSRTVLGDVRRSLRENTERWNGYLAAVGVDGAVGADGAVDNPRQNLAVKSVQTLIDNWRGPLGRIRHSSLFPSSNVWYFNGFWAWDSWKHAVALVRFDGELAKEQVRAMFDHQDASGMIADVVYLDADEDNWRDTKPPLSGWAIEAIYRATGDLAFVRDLYPKLVRYHQFWYADRDHDRDGLCEYGSTDGTLVAARWESGMDNAVRFDESAMLENGPRAWSLDQESVDLNSYLFREKQSLAFLADALGDEAESTRWTADAERLGGRIREAMFDPETGWFYDIAIAGDAIVPVQGPEGWIPLWAGVATDEQAAQVRTTLLDPTKFRTHVPFPTVVRDDPEFSDGYWRGLVWLDQAYFAIEGLRRYGYDEDAEALTDQLFSNLEGATEPGVPLFENYHPLTGEGQNVKHFSWTAAHLLLLTMAGDG